jgi:tripartite-type tricarboxylate transporter receptor subunit TctC
VKATQFSRRRILSLAASAAALLAVARLAKAQAYPTRPIKWIVGLPPGGAADAVARIMGAWLFERLGQPVIIENRPGGAQNIAIQAVVNSPPDGYTLLWLGVSNIINKSLFDNLPFDVLRDITPVCGLVHFPMVMVAHPSVAAKTVPEFIALAKANPGKINMASFGTGSASHIAGELFNMMAGVNLVHVPYRGGAQMITDLVGGQVQVAFDVMSQSLPQIRAGALRALANAGKTRFDGLADVPTIAETVPGYEASTWAGIGVPRGTPPEIIERLNREANAGLAIPAIKARLMQASTVPMILTPETFAAYVASEAERWGKVVKFANIKSE